MIPDNKLHSDVSNEITPEMSAELDAAMKAATSAPESAPAQTHGKPPVQAGNARAPGTRGPRIVQAGRVHRAGTVVSVGPTDIFVEFGPKELGVVPRLQWPDDKDLPVAGQEIQLVVDKHEPAENLYICSRPGSVQKADWELLEPGQIVEARVSGVATNKEGKQVGLELEVANHRAFMPAGQVSTDRVPDFSVFVGEKMKCMVTRVERFGKGNIVLSRREILDEERKARMDELRKTLVEGATVEGVVRRIVDFGAFVDIGGVDGLLHMSDITYDRIFPGAKNIEKYVKVNDRIRVQILKVDREDPAAAQGEQAQGEEHGEGGDQGGGKKHDRPRKSFRVSLGLKQVQGDPMSQSVIAEGADVMVKITRIAEFGAFAEIAPGVEGLIHISEIDHKRINKVEDALKPNEVVQAKILKIDHANRRISLSVKALKALPEIQIGEGGGGGGDGQGGRGGPGRGGPGGPGRGGPGGGRGGRGGERIQGRSIEEITKETPALRRAREKARNLNFKGGLS